MYSFSFLISTCLLASVFGGPLLVKDAKISQNLTRNNRLSGRIVGGSPATEGAFPYQVSLQEFGQHFCGGSIVSERWIMSAGHCLSGTPAYMIRVVVGTSDLRKGGKSYLGDKAVVHPNYNLEQLTGDIALLRVKEKIAFSENVSPISLPSDDISKADDPVIVSGWGRTSVISDIPTQLQFLNSRIYNQDKCLTFSTLVSEKNICTFTKKGEGLCNGDSGGPVVVNDVQVGIVSWGNPCARGFPDVHTRVFSYVKWIEKTIGTEEETSEEESTDENSFRE